MIWQTGFGCDGEDGTWYSLSFDAVDGIHAQVSNGDTATNYTGFPLRLGMRESGLIYALDFWDEAGGEELSICALQPGNGMLVMQHLTGGSRLGCVRGKRSIYLRPMADRREKICRSQFQSFPQIFRNLRRLPHQGMSRSEFARCFCARYFCSTEIKTTERAAMNLLRGPRPMTPYDVQFLRDLLPGTKRFGELKKSVGNRRS